MFKDLVANYYAPLRPYVNRYTRKLGRFFWNLFPDVILIISCVAVFMWIGESFFWH